MHFIEVHIIYFVFSPLQHTVYCLWWLPVDRSKSYLRALFPAFERLCPKALKWRASLSFLWWLIKLSLSRFLSADKVDCRSSDKTLTPLVHLNLHFEEKNETPISILCLYFPVCVLLNTRHDLGSHYWWFIFMYPAVATHTQCTFTQYSIT